MANLLFERAACAQHQLHEVGLRNMPINDFRVQLATAYSGLQRVGSGKGRTLRGRIETDEGSKMAYIKLLDIESIAIAADTGQREVAV